MKWELLSWLKHVGYMVLNYQPANVGKTRRRFDRNAPIFAQKKTSKHWRVFFLHVFRLVIENRARIQYDNVIWKMKLYVNA